MKNRKISLLLTVIIYQITIYSVLPHLQKCVLVVGSVHFWSGKIVCACEIFPTPSSSSYVTLIKLLKLPKFSFIWKVRNIQIQTENNLTKVCFLMVLFLLIMYSLLVEYSCSNYPVLSTRTLIYLFSFSASHLLITFVATSYVYAFSKISILNTYDLMSRLLI